MKLATLLTFLGATLIASPLGQASAQSPTPSAQSPTPSAQYDQLTYRYIGPVGNRVSAVTGVPGDANVYFIGAASGGIFRTTDAGASWDPVFDDQPVASIGALAVDPVNTNVIWAGTGETFIRSNVLTGNGIYTSVDNGDSWQHMGLDHTGRIGGIVVDPQNPNVVCAAALGQASGPQEERGV
jgi:hypothetical protein